MVLAAGSGGDPTSEPVAGKAIKQAYQQYTGMAFPSAATPVDVVRLDGPPLPTATTYAGIPTLRLSVVSDPPGTGAGGPTTGVAAYQVDPKLYDVAPDGTATLITRGAYAEQLGAGAPRVHQARFDAFAFAHTFPAGHHARLTLSSADVAYLRPNTTAFQVALLPGSALDLPGAERPTAAAYGLPGADAGGPDPSVPEASLPAVLPVVALGLGLLLVRRRTAMARVSRQARGARSARSGSSSGRPRPGGRSCRGSPAA